MATIDELEEVLSEAAQTQKDTADQIQETVEQQENVVDVEGTFATVGEQALEDIEATSAQIQEELSGTFDAINEKLNAVRESPAFSAETFEEAQEGFQQFEEELVGITESVVEGATSVEQAKSEIATATDEIKQQLEGAFDVEQAEEFQGVVQSLKEDTETVGNQVEEANVSLETAVGLGGGLAESFGTAREFLGENLGIFGTLSAVLGKVVSKAKSFVELVGSGLLATGIVAVVAALGTAVDLLEGAFDASSQFRQETGATTEQLARLRDVTQSTATELAKFGLEPGKTADIALQLRESFGSIETATAVTGENLETLNTQTAAISNAFAVGAQEAAKIRAQTEQLENQIGGSAENAIAVTEAFANANDVAPQAAIQQITENSEQLAKFSGRLDEDLAKAAVQAERLGTSIGSASQFQEQFLGDITGSIQGIQEANQLLGGQLNAQRLLQASYEGTAETQEEIISQLQGIDVENLNPFQRQKIEQALPGYDFQEIAQIAEAREELRGIRDNTTAVAEKIRTGEVSLTAALGTDQTGAFTQFNRQLDVLYFTLAEELAPTLENVATTALPIFTNIVKIAIPLVKGFGEGLNVVLGVISALTELLTGDFTGAFEQLKSTFGGIIETFSGLIDEGSVAVNIISTLATVAASVVGVMTGWSVLTSAVAGLTSVLQTAGFAIAAVGTAGGTTSAIMGVLGGAVTGVGNAFAFLGSVLTATGIGALIIGLAAAIGGLVYATRNWDQTTRFVSESITFLSNKLSGAKEVVGNLIGSFMNLGSVFDGVGAFFMDLGNMILNSVVSGFNDTISYIKNNWQSLLIDALTFALGGIPGLIAKALIPDWQTVKRGLTNILSGVRSYLPSSPAEQGPLSDLNKVDLTGALTESMSPEQVQQKTEQTVGAAAEGAQQAQVEVQSAAGEVRTVDTGGDQTQQQQQIQQEGGAGEGRSTRQLLQQIANSQQQMLTALQNGNISVYLDGRKVNKEITRNVRDVVEG